MSNNSNQDNNFTPPEQYNNPSHKPEYYSQPTTPPPGYYPSQQTNVNTQNNWQGIASLSTSIASAAISLFLGAVITLPLAIAGVIFGHMGVSSAKKGTANNKGLSIAGMVIGYVILGVTIALIGLLVLGLAMWGLGSN